ncbi:class I SAM-dependent methyltransferase [Microvirga rosea]|uniref:class I SAM-dependent methyltransferase n=1 Tax=Microvirga rosea TaxID=2715425 RepID=UPI001D0AF674|nr:class I SAM-dependent methyltransferase [Microvirga rosea]MCB8822505.1 methyltransferase domain-containing protein [Microvirga rosea]
MRLGAHAETVLEWLALRLNLGPKPLADTQAAFQFAQIIMCASKAGLFEALQDGGRTAEEIAALRSTNPRATSKVLDALLAHGYLQYRNGRYELNRLSRKWLLADSPYTLVHKLDFQEVEWRWTEGFDQWLYDGIAQDMHRTLRAEEWRRYQWGMRDFSTAPATEVAWRARMPAGAQTLLDIGGSHGFYSVQLCRRHQELTATILELPEAIPTAAEILAREGMGHRVAHVAGNALDDDLGADIYDAVLIANLVHHFDTEQNLRLVQKVARALRPGGVLMIMDAIRIASPTEANRPDRRLGAVLDVFFALTSASGTCSVEAIQEWQRTAGLRILRPIWLKTMPGAALLPAMRTG